VKSKEIFLIEPEIGDIIIPINDYIPVKWYKWQTQFLEKQFIIKSINWSLEWIQAIPLEQIEHVPYVEGTFKRFTLYKKGNILTKLVM
jgi:hypothetical protein